MYTSQTIDRQQVAGNIYDRLEYDYKYALPQASDLAKSIGVLSAKLAKLPEHEVILWAQALDNIGAKDNTHAPSQNEIINEIRRIAYAQKERIKSANPTLQQPEKKTDYITLWQLANDRQKFSFFIDHKFSDVPAFVAVWFKQYNAEHRGWTNYESQMMLGYWKKPFAAAEQGAQINHQREIIDYFTKRKA
jgi:hypothetical protein